MKKDKESVTTQNVTNINNIEDYFTETSSGLDIEANNIDCNCITSRNNNFSLDSLGNLSVNSLNINNSQNNVMSFDAILNRVYPVGAIYISVGNTNPSSLFGGTWEIIQGKFLLSSSTDYLVGNTGGEANHTLTVSEMPSHTHLVGKQPTGIYAPAGDISAVSFWASDGGIPSSATGGNQPHNNMPPYLVVNMWKRIS